MGTAFRRGKDGRYTATLHEGEAELLRSLAGQILELLADGEAVGGSGDPLEDVLDLASPEPPVDPVLRRLFPDAYAEDTAAADFRRYTERGLRESKRHNALAVLTALDAAEERDGRRLVHVPASDGAAWLKALTDLRLALGTRLGVEQDGEPEWLDDAEDPRRYVYGVYEWLGWLQDSLVRAVMRASGRDGGHVP